MENLQKSPPLPGGFSSTPVRRSLDFTAFSISIWMFFLQKISPKKPKFWSFKALKGGGRNWNFIKDLYKPKTKSR